ncbi:hypothetical protein [Hydrococcus rivularis]|uniref:hypothetical protein n=1 Tax=Hydrococcus rivularis TaxID=1616834 RepID=UPI000B2E7C55|nr:hypothetical protein [Hydrococcus rivularis]
MKIKLIFEEQEIDFLVRSSQKEIPLKERYEQLNLSFRAGRPLTQRSGVKGTVG